MQALAAGPRCFLSRSMAHARAEVQPAGMAYTAREINPPSLPPVSLLPVREDSQTAKFDHAIPNHRPKKIAQK